VIELPHLDCNVCENCDKQCTGCSHASPILPPWSMPLEMIERDLLALKPFVTVGHLQILGGEPLLHKEIVGILRLVKRIRIDVCTTVITNGNLLPRMTEDFWRELEYLQISIYPTLDPKIPWLAECKSREYGFGLGTTVFDSFYREIKAVPDDGVESFRNCGWRHDCYTVHRGHFYLCSQSCFFPKAIQGLPPEIDGLPLEGLTEEKLGNFMNRTEPFNACRVCCAPLKQRVPWRESKRREWSKDSAD